MTQTARPLLRAGLRNAVLIFFYVVSGMIGLHMAATGGGYSAPVWLPSGLAVAAVLLYGWRMLPGVWVGAFITNYFVRPELSLHNAALAAAVATGNCGEAAAARLLLGDFKLAASFLRLADVGKFIRAAILASLLSATIGVTCVSIVHPIPLFSAAAAAWVTWWIGDTLGMIVLAPLLIALLSEKPAQRTPRVRWGRVLAGAVLLIVFVAALGRLLPREMISVFIGIIMYSVVIWSALVLPVRGFFTVTAVVCAQAVFRAYEGVGLFGSGDIVERLTLLQFFLGCISLVGLVLNAVVSERFTAGEIAHQREVALMRAEKMSALGEMASGIAHEIGNPLMVIYARIEQALTMLQEGHASAAALSPILEKIDAMAGRIDQIVRSVRFFSRNPERDPFRPSSLKSIVDDTLELCREQFRRHEVSLAIDPIAEDATIDCKPVLIAQVLLNLLSNARDAVQERPVRWVRVSFRMTERDAEIAVEDSGSGVPAELRGEIFQPFFTTKVTGRGTGLGLSVSRNIVESHHGTIALDESCANTRFVVRLPLHPSPAAVPKLRL